jgi:hypothetical protein
VSCYVIDSSSEASSVIFNFVWVVVLLVLVPKLPVLFPFFVWVVVRNKPKQGLCLTTRCELVQFELGQFDMDEDEDEWPNAFGWQNFETLNVCYQIC